MSEEIKDTAVENTPAVSKSKAKREARKAEAKADKAKKGFDTVLGWVLSIVIAAAVITLIVLGVIDSSSNKEIIASDDFSAGLTAEGYVQGAKLEKVKDLGLDNLVIPAAEIEYTDEDVQSNIDSFLAACKYYDDNAALTVADGDSINLNYSGSIDGVVFDGGTAENQTLVIGSKSFIDDFEEQLIGLHPGDEKDVVVTFPDPYDNNPDLAGKEAVFACKVNSIQQTPELTDALVAENAEGFASTVEELKAFFKDSGTESNVKTYITNYIAENAEVSAAPKEYVKHLKSINKYTDEQTFNYYNQYYYSLTGTYMYNTFSDFTQMSDEEYESTLNDNANQQVALDMTYEKYFKDKNLTISEDDYNEVLENYGGEDAVTTYGEAFLRQVTIKYTVVNYLYDNANIQ